MLAAHLLEDLTIYEQEQLLVIGLKDLRNDDIYTYSDRHASKFCSHLVVRAGLFFADRFCSIDRALQSFLSYKHILTLYYTCLNVDG